MQPEETASVVEDVPGVGQNPLTKTSKWGVVKTAQRRILPRQSIGEIKLTNLINELQSFAIKANETVHTEPISRDKRCYSLRVFRQRLFKFLQNPTFHYIVITLVILDLIIVLIDLILGRFQSENFFSFKQ